MTDHEPAPDLMAIAEDAFIEATEANISTEDNRDLIHATFDKLITNAVGKGEIEIRGKSVTRAISDYAWMRVNGSSARRTQRYLKDLHAGIIPLFEQDEILDAVLTAGEDRRTTLRHLNPLDVDRMVLSRAKNLAKQIAANADFEVIGAWLKGLLSEYGSIPAAIAAGAITFRADPQTETA